MLDVEEGGFDLLFIDSVDHKYIFVKAIRNETVFQSSTLICSTLHDGDLKVYVEGPQVRYFVSQFV